jgi:hypothetical protein
MFRLLLFSCFPVIKYRKIQQCSFFALFSPFYVSFSSVFLIITLVSFKLLNKSFNSFDFSYYSQRPCTKKFTMLPDFHSHCNLALLHKAGSIWRIQKYQTNLSGKNYTAFIAGVISEDKEQHLIFNTTWFSFKITSETGKAGQDELFRDPMRIF